MITKTTIPLLKDNHNHPYLYASFKNTIHLESVRDKELAFALIRASNKEITVATGWNNSFFDLTPEELNSLPPLVVCNVSFHGYLINQPARELLAFSHKEIVENIDDAAWVERNLFSVFKFIATINPPTDQEVQEFYDVLLLQYGIWYAEEMLLPNSSVLNTFYNIDHMDRTAFWADIDTFDSLSQEKKEYIKGIKIFTDGALGSRTAALKSPLLTGEQGVLNYTNEQLYLVVNKAVDTGKALSLHAIGDHAFEQVLSVLNEVKVQRGYIPATRVEHCQFVTPDMAQQAKNLRITLSMQPNFNCDSQQYSDRLPEDYRKNNNNFRMLIDEIGFTPGHDLIFGSDGMPHGMPFALEQVLFPTYPSQQMSIEEFAAAYCLPDMERGHLEVTIDNEKRKVSSQITLAETLL